MTKRTSKYGTLFAGDEVEPQRKIRIDLMRHYERSEVIDMLKRLSEPDVVRRVLSVSVLRLQDDEALAARCFLIELFKESAGEL